MWSFRRRSSDSGPNDWPDDFGRNSVEVDPAKSMVSSKSYPTTSSVTTLQNLPLLESNFGEIECGEPQISQQLFFDFTPNTELDTPEVREKVMDFFEFINAQKNIAHLCQMPEQDVESEKQAKVKTSKKGDKDSFEREDFMNEPVAQNVLEKYKACVSHLKDDDMKIECYPVGDDDTISDISEHKDAGTAKKVSSRKQAKLTSLCQTLDDWDKKHPKCMEPPGPPIQHRPILQRRKPPDNAY